MNEKKHLCIVAYDYLYEAIITNKLTPSRVIVEQKISDKIGISRTPIRETLQQPTSEGLVRQIPSRGTFVHELNSRDVEEMFKLREIFEDYSLRSGIAEIPYENLLRLENAFKMLTPTSSPEEFYSCDRNLHALISQPLMEKKDGDFLNHNQFSTRGLQHIYAMTPHRLDQSTKVHLNIIN